MIRQLAVACLLLAPAYGGETSATTEAPPITITEVENGVEILRAGAVTPEPGLRNKVLYAGDRIITGRHGRATLFWSDGSVVRIGPLSDKRILPPRGPAEEPGFDLLKGVLYFFHRERPASLRFRTRTAVAAVRGTEFSVQQAEGREVITVLDGSVEVTVADSRFSLESGEEISMAPDRSPLVSPALQMANVIQWALYYPAILDLDELELTSADRPELAESLQAYRAGNLREAVASYPFDREGTSPNERLYRAALLLAGGKIDEVAAILQEVQAQSSEPETRLADALTRMMAAVRNEQRPPSRSLQLATEWLAESYQQQAQGNLQAALTSAQTAVDRSRANGSAYIRLAELQFSFGRSREAQATLDEGLQLAPQHAQGITLLGFVLAAQNKFREAWWHFESAIALDGALANAWLGRGLCRIRDGARVAGQRDLLIAAALEPQRALLRSYLGKAYAEANDPARARGELIRAEDLDPADPTAWFYSALLKQQHNEINDGIRDLEQSRKLNDNRRVFRSRLLLDQDRAVRSVNLAALYRDAGLVDVSAREAGRAVNDDYVNYSAHLFLANSYDELRDPRRINLRYETPAEAEYLIANLLATASAGTMAPAISPQEYTRLFDRPRLGFKSSTEYLSYGAWSQAGAVYAADDTSAMALEAFYRDDDGERPNQDFRETDLRAHVKLQLTPQDSIYLRTLLYDSVGGDRLQYYSQTNANLGVRVQERQEPLFTAGYHHEWQPGVHTLLTFNRLQDHLQVQNPTQITFLVGTNAIPPGLDYVEAMGINQFYDSSLVIYSGEAQQIHQTERHLTVVGARFQAGDFRTENLQTHPIQTPNQIFFWPPPTPAADQSLDTSFSRASAYLYHTWEVVEPLRLTAGLAYDHLYYPVNFRATPISDEHEQKDSWSPKAGLVWAPFQGTTFRAAYTRSLAGASIDQSTQIEPTQVAGFNQSFRSILPETVAGANAGSRFETFGASIEQTLPTGTYLAVGADMLSSELNRDFGVFALDFDSYARVHQMANEVDFDERNLYINVAQLLSREWTVGVRYHIRDSSVDNLYPEAVGAQWQLNGFQESQHLEATLHRVHLFTVYNHPSGFFGQVGGLYTTQSNRGYTPDIPGDRFWQLNAFVGYRFTNRKAELRFGVLNLTDQEYHLNPLTLYRELPRERTFTVRLQISL